MLRMDPEMIILSPYKTIIIMNTLHGLEQGNTLYGLEQGKVSLSCG